MKAVSQAKARREAITSASKPANERLALIARCERKWPGNYEMQKYCTDNQSEAAKEMSAVIDAAAGNAQLNEIIIACSAKWKDGDTWNFEMVAYCYKNQSEALAQMRAERGD